MFHRHRGRSQKETVVCFPGFTAARRVMVNVALLIFYAIAMISTSWFIAKPIPLLKEVTRCSYYNIKAISSMEIIFIVLSHSGLWNFYMSSRTRMRWYIYFILYPFHCFNCTSVRVVVKVFPYFYYFRGYSAVFMSLYWQHTMWTEHVFR